MFWHSRKWPDSQPQAMLLVAEQLLTTVWKAGGVGGEQGSTAQLGTVWHSVALYDAVWRSVAQYSTAHCKLTLMVTHVASIALGEGVGVGEKGAGGTGYADAVVSMARAVGLQEFPCGQQGDNERGHRCMPGQCHATIAVASGTPGAWRRASQALLTWGTLGTAPTG